MLRTSRAFDESRVKEHFLLWLKTSVNLWVKVDNVHFSNWQIKEVDLNAYKYALLLITTDGAALTVPELVAKDMNAGPFKIPDWCFFPV